MKRTEVWIPIGVAAASLVVWAFIRRDRANADSYRFVAVERGSIESVVTGTGKIEALETVEVGTHVSGQIAELFVDFNDRVEQGQLLSRIDPTILRQEVRSADANLMRSRADLEQAEHELKRARELHESRVMTTSELETAALLRPEAQKRLTVPLGHGAATRANLDAWVSRRYGGWAIGDSAEPSAWGGYSVFSASVGWIPAARRAAR